MSSWYIPTKVAKGDETMDFSKLPLACLRLHAEFSQKPVAREDSSTHRAVETVLTRDPVPNHRQDG